MAGVERVFSLPGAGSSWAVISSRLGQTPAALREAPGRPIDRLVLRDRWGKQLMSQPLDGYQSLFLSSEARARGSNIEALEPGLELVRCRKSEGVVCQLSDGSELVCTGVLFADGPFSRGRDLMERVSRSHRDKQAVACWSFVRQDLLDLRSWEFRTALGKSVELLPLPGGRQRVKLRFRTPSGARQLPAQLRELFSEFGPEVESLLEGVEPDSISYWDEEEPARIAFCPLPGTLALGQAALGLPLLESFDWDLRLTRAQLERVVESLLAGHWDPPAFEPHCWEALRPLLASERYLRGSLHYDNALLRPLRDVMWRLLPSSLLASRLKERLTL